MLGQFSLLPLVKGWEYKVHTAERTVVRGAQPIEVLTLNEMGDLLLLTLASNDAYGTVTVQFQGADLQPQTESGYAELYHALSGWTQDPCGWTQKYFRPNPNSTAGIYVTIIWSGGAEGSILSYVPTIRVKLSLGIQSTQHSCGVYFASLSLAITDKKLFITSLRRLLNADASLTIDPALLTVGPVEMRKEIEKGS
jgi:hypothetical protein